MALTSEQEQALELARETANVQINLQRTSMEFSANLEYDRRRHEIEIEARRSRLETIRLAKEVLIEVTRSKPVDQRDISANVIVDYADVLTGYINQN